MCSDHTNACDAQHNTHNGKYIICNLHIVKILIDSTKSLLGGAAVHVVLVGCVQLMLVCVPVVK